MKELKLEELTVEQKLGMVSCGLISSPFGDRTDETDEHALELIRNHSLGSIWVNPKAKNFDRIMAKIKETADYPILIFTDAESGLGDNMVGYHNAIGAANSEELAYIFGKVTAINARKMGYNVVCNPILDSQPGSLICGGNIRNIAGDKFRVAKLSAAMARGMHDGGVLTVGKHYPSASREQTIDPHMGEPCSEDTEENLLSHNLYPYMELMKEGLLDGIMTEHCRLINVDDQYPASLSSKVLNIIRDHGFDGFMITDAMSMMGVVAKFGDTDSKGMAIEAGNDISLNWTVDTLVGYKAICEAYANGVISDERLDAAVAKVLEAQHKTLVQPKFEEITETDLELFAKINTESVYAKSDAGLTHSISKDGKHYFVVLVDNKWTKDENIAADVATFAGKWYRPVEIINKLENFFVNSKVVTLSLYPSGAENCNTMNNSVGYDDIVFITYQDIQAYIGKECLSSRVLSLIEAFQLTGRISTVVHLGNPYVLEDLPHIPRVIIGGASSDSVMASLEVLSGEREAKGSLTYDVHFKEVIDK